MHKLVVGDGYAYLTRQVAAGDAGLEPGASLTAYYEATGNPPGRWCGAGLAGLGHEPAHRVRVGDRVSEEAMAAVFRDGHDPVTGESLGRAFQGSGAVVGFDLTFTAMKSVSVLWGLADDATRTTVYAAHRAALDQALGFVEQTPVLPAHAAVLAGSRAADADVSIRRRSSGPPCTLGCPLRVRMTQPATCPGRVRGRLT